MPSTNSSRIRLLEVLEKVLEDELKDIEILWISSEQDVAESNARIIIDLNFLNSDNWLDILGKKFNKLIIPKMNALFSLWQGFANSFNRKKSVRIYTGILPIHRSHPSPIIMPEPELQFLALFNKTAYFLRENAIEGVHPLSLSDKIMLQIGDVYRFDYIAFPLLDRFFLFNTSRFFYEIESFLVGWEGLITTIEVFQRFNLFSCENISETMRSFEVEDIFLMSLVIIDRQTHSLSNWKVEFRYDYHNGIMGFEKATIALVKAFISSLPNVKDKQPPTAGILWPLDIFCSDHGFKELVKEIKKQGGLITYEEFNKNYL